MAEGQSYAGQAVLPFLPLPRARLQRSRLGRHAEQLSERLKPKGYAERKHYYIHLPKTNAFQKYVPTYRRVDSNHVSDFVRSDHNHGQQERIFSFSLSVFCLFVVVCFVVVVVPFCCCCLFNFLANI